MPQPQTIEGTGEELERYLRKRPQERFRLTQLSSDDEKPFYETATAEEWNAAFRDWAEGHSPRPIPLSDEAMDRDNIYEGRG